MARDRWQVYVLRCADGSLYTGVTSNLDRRLRLHHRGRASRYTRSRLPVTLVYRERASSRSTAQRREWEIKRLSRAEKDRLVTGRPSARPVGP